MTVSLLDVNVLIALWWPAHESHVRAQHWFARNAKAGWATCPFTQAAVIRILSNPAFSPDALTVEEAIGIVEANLRHPAHQFWADDVSFSDAVLPFQKRLFGHKQVTDAYLLGLAIHRSGKLATLDRAILDLLEQKDNRNLLIVVI